MRSPRAVGGKLTLMTLLAVPTFAQSDREGIAARFVPGVLYARVRHVVLLTIALLQGSCAGMDSARAGQVGKFEIQRDLFLAHFDLKTDVDDLHSVAGVATMLADPRLAEVQYHAVAGAYGTQEGLYVPANELFEMAFGERWSDAHGNFEAALSEVSALVSDVLASGGTVWIADGGQSDFSAAVVRAVQEGHRDLDTKRHIHIVQHADWNEEVTAPENLAFVKQAATYHRIPDGNTPGNGTPGFRSDDVIDWRAYVENPRLVTLWERAIDIANAYNGMDGRYLNTSIQKGGLDFSDVSETTWIFGFTELDDARDFFAEFGSRQD
jgi:hypothetical protein